jgi:hypothetical protein
VTGIIFAPALSLRLRYLREAIGHIDATLSLFDPNGDPKEITAKRPYKRVRLFASGKLGCLVLDAPRRGACPMTTRGIVASIVEKIGYGPDAAKGMSHRIRANLLYPSKVVGASSKPASARRLCRSLWGTPR